MSWLRPDQVPPQPHRVDLRLWGSVALLGVVALFFGVRVTGLGPRWLGRPATEWQPWVEIGAAIATAVAIVVALLEPRFRVLYRTYRGMPGALAFRADQLDQLSAALENDGRELSSSTVPVHDARARPATSAANLHLGDALLSVPSQVVRTVTRFVKAPHRRSSVPDSVLVVLGAPGSGKSVLLQELQATLGQGVALGRHSLVPFLVFARDLSLELLDQARPEGMAWLLTRLYEERKHRGNDPRLVATIELLRHDWLRTDALVIVDGLDEIPPRRMMVDENGMACSEYELIHQRLAALIEADIRASPVAHRYVLSCRSDEDVGRFPGAGYVFLPELDERAKARLIDALSRRAFRPVWAGNVMARPLHLYDRSPYFLALLCSHAPDKDDYESGVLSFDDLMRSYLRREVLRPYSGMDRAKRKAFVERCEPVSRVALEWLAFDLAGGPQGGNLYAERPLEADLAKRFVKDLARLEPGRAPSHRLAATRRLVASCLEGHVDARALARELHPYFDREDVHIFSDLARHPLDADGIARALEGLPESRVEAPQWYADVAFALAQSFAGGRGDVSRLAILVFIRGIFAAHALRVLRLVLVSGKLWVRFRHRRLAEYFAACYLRDRWSDLGSSLPPARDAPWLGPVLNLTCAIQGDDCPAVARLASDFEQTPDQPAFLWRYAFEAVIEGISFSNDGPARRSAATLALRRAGDRLCDKSMGAEGGDPISKIAVLAALDTLERAQLASSAFIPLVPDQSQRLLEAVGRLPGSWVTHRVAAISAIHRLSGRTMALATRGMRLLNVVSQPGDYLAFVPNGSARSRLFATMARLAVVAGELLVLGTVLGAYLLVHRRVVVEWPASSAVMLDLRPWFLGIIGSTSSILRLRSHIGSSRYARNSAVAPVKIVASGLALSLAVMSAPVLVVTLGPSSAVRAIRRIARGLTPLAQAFTRLRENVLVDVAIGTARFLISLLWVVISFVFWCALIVGGALLAIFAMLFLLELLGVSTTGGGEASKGKPTPAEHRPEAGVESRFKVAANPLTQAERERDIDALAKVLCSPPPVLPERATRSVALFTSMRAGAEVKDLTRLRDAGKSLTSSDIGSRCGAEVTPLDDDLLAAIDSRLASSQQVESSTRAQNTWTVAVSWLVALAVMMVGAIGLTLLRQARLKSEMGRLPPSQEISSLCDAVLAESSLEPVRLEALRRLGASDISAQEMTSLENALSELSRRASRDAVIEAQLAMVIRGHSNRLRHRSAEGRGQVAR